MTKSNREFEQVSLEETVILPLFPSGQRERGWRMALTGGDFGRYKEKQCHTVIKQAGKVCSGEFSVNTKSHRNVYTEVLSTMLYEFL